MKCHRSVVKQEHKQMPCACQITALSVNLGLSLLAEPGLPTSGPVELQPGEGGPRVLSHQLPLQTFTQLVCSTDVLHLALLKHDVDAFKTSYAEATASNRNWKNEVMGCMNVLFIFLVLTHQYCSTGKYSDEGGITSCSEPGTASVQLWVVCLTFSHSVKYSANHLDRNY